MHIMRLIHLISLLHSNSVTLDSSYLLHNISHLNELKENRLLEKAYLFWERLFWKMNVYTWFKGQ